MTSDHGKWDRQWRDPSYRPAWWVDGPHVLIRTAVEDGWLPRGCSVLEIGCGAGQGAGWLSKAGFKVVGIDISPEAIRLARRDFAVPKGPIFEVADVVGPDTLGRTFDTIIDSGCFHNIAADHHARYVRNIMVWSRVGTRFLLMVHCGALRPIDWLYQACQLFGLAFDLVSCEARAGCLPREPQMTMMAIRLFRADELPLVSATPASGADGLTCRASWVG
jgi:SAM-dependent methyltransferase